MIIAAAVMLAAFISGVSAADNLPVVEILGQKYYVYEIKKGDSLFGIARENGWDDAELKRLNPSATSPLKKGAKLYYPVSGAADKSVVPTVSNPEEAGLLSPLTHKVKKGETVYSISRTYGIPVNTIYQLNPSSKTGIKAGETLTLRKQEIRGTGNRDMEGYYTVKKGDTLYKVARDHGVTVAAILQENPGVSEKNFQAGSIIKMPKSGTGITMVTDTVKESTLQGFDVHKAGKKDTWNSIAESKGVSVSDLKKANPEVKEPKNNQLIAIPKIETVEVEKEVIREDPREVTSEGVADIYEDVHRIVDVDIDEPMQINVAVVLSEPSSKKDLEFSRGFLTAMDEMKRSGTKVNLKFIEGNASSNDILSQLKEFKPAIIYLTADSNLPDYLAEYSTTAQVPMVNTFDVKSEDYTDNPYLIQLLAPTSYFNDGIAEYIQKKYKGYKLIMAGEEDEGDQLALSLQEVWTPSDVITMPEADFSEYTFSDGNNYVIYGSPVKKAEVSNLVTSVIAAQENNPMVEIKVIGRPNWIVFDESLGEKFHKADVNIPSRFYFDKESSDGKMFISRFKEIFDRTPVKSFPVYAAMGYDAASYFVKEMALTGGDINKFSGSDNTLQIPVRLKRPSNWTGLLNPAVYMVRFTPYDTIEKNVVE